MNAIEQLLNSIEQLTLMAKVLNIFHIFLDGLPIDKCLQTKLRIYTRTNICTKIISTSCVLFCALGESNAES